jgi:phosphopantetheine--protein transferase-like protein
MHKEIGVDVEKITEHFKEGVAKRFFNASEYAQLLALPEHERPRMFYHFWARKEALQKSIGNGLFENTDNHAQYDIESFFVHADYEAAFAITPPLLTVEQWEWRPKNYVKLS